jgi:hypothetical protein
LELSVVLGGDNPTVMKSQAGKAQEFCRKGVLFGDGSGAETRGIRWPSEEDEHRRTPPME